MEVLVKTIKILAFIITLILILPFYSYASQYRVNEQYDCEIDSCLETIKYDKDKNGIFETYSIIYCDQTVSSFPIFSCGDISKWPPPGIMRITDLIFNSRSSFIEFYIDSSSGNPYCWFVKHTDKDTVFYYDNPNSLSLSRLGLDNSSDIITDVAIHQYTSHSYLNIQIDAKSINIVDLKIVNILGSTIDVMLNGAKIEGIYTTSFNTSYLPNGIYFAIYMVNGQPLIKKFIVAK